MSAETKSPGDQATDTKGEFKHNGVTFNEFFPLEVLQKIPDLEYKDDDVVLTTYPKCGTTWMSEILYSLQNNSTPGEGKMPIMALLPFLEFHMPPRPPGIVHMEQIPSPRILKTHLKSEYFTKALDKGVKFVVVFRNVKDAVVSYYHYYKKMDTFSFQGDFNQFFKLFRDNELCFGDWYDWTLDWWKLQDHSNVAFFYYEDMKADIEKEIKRVADFLGKDVTDERVKEIADATDFDKLKAKQMSKYGERGVSQMRKGVIGDWQEYFSEEQLAHVNALSETKLTGTGLKFRDT